MAAGNRKIVEIMSRGNFQGPGTKILFHVGVKDNGNFAADQGQNHRRVTEPMITCITGVHGHRRVAKHGFRPGGGHHQMAAAIG